MGMFIKFNDNAGDSDVKVCPVIEYTWITPIGTIVYNGTCDKNASSLWYDNVGKDYFKREVLEEIYSYIRTNKPDSERDTGKTKYC